jgi:3-oxoacyl-[acyl-carrier-protein] synthase II
MNAHGPGTQQCDTVEAAVLDELLEGKPQIYSIKPLAGHCQGAAAAVEVAAAALGYAHQLVPAAPTVARGHRRLVNGLTPMKRGMTLKTSLGMGGHNAAVVLAPVA